MRKISGSITLILVFSFFMFCYAVPNGKNRVKDSLIEEIVQKIGNISLKKFSNTPREEKSRLIKEIEQKLKKTANALGSKGAKYVRLIMNGVRLKAYANDQNKPRISYDLDGVVSKNNEHPVDNNSKESKNNNKAASQDIEPQTSDNIKSDASHHDKRQPGESKVDGAILRTNSASPNLYEELSSIKVTKEELIHNIARKIENLAQDYLKSAHTKEARQRAFEIIKRKVKQTAARKKSRLHKKLNDIKKYVELIEKGIRVMMEKNARNVTRRMEIQFNKDINIDKQVNENGDYSLKSKNADLYIDNKLGYGTLKEENDRREDFKKSIPMESIKHNDLKLKLKHVTFKLNNDMDANSTSSCADDVKESCNKIKLLKKFTCSIDNKVIHISKICDGKADCIDYSDETNCARKALDSVRYTSQVMSHIDSTLARDCYPALLDDGILSKKKGVLRKVLQKQLDFIQQHTSASSDTAIRDMPSVDTPTLKNTVQEVINVVSILSSSLKTAICSNNTLHDTRKQGVSLSKQLVAFNPTTWSPASCECNGEKCASACTTDCVSVCYQRFSLGRWQCNAVSGETSVHVNMICDGKLDCYDETDEKNCNEERSISRYEATEMYNYIKKIVLAKTYMKQYNYIRNGLLSLHSFVEELQKLTLKRSPDVLEVKRVRDECFAKMLAIYNSGLSYATTPEDAMELYVFLISLNEKLMSAMKRSHTGNDRIIAANNCVCRGYECALTLCPKSCLRACSAEPKLSRYFCGGSSSINNSISIDALCNGRRDCDRGDDEKDCKQEVCRSHHLKLLRNNLRDVGKKYKGTSVGETLLSWKTKVIASILYVENDDRPTLNVIQDLVISILHDLVMAYGSIEDYHHQSSNKAFDEFQKWSRVVIEVVKSCGH